MVFSGTSPIEIDGKTVPREGRSTDGELRAGDRHLLRRHRSETARGARLHDDDLDARQPVAIVNAAFAQKHFGSESALGRRFRTATADGTQQAGPWRTIVGVVTTVRMLGPFNQPGVDETGFYVPFFSNPVGPIPQSLFASQFTTIVVEAARRAARRRDGDRAAARRWRKSIRICRSTSSGRRESRSTASSGRIASSQRCSRSSGSWRWCWRRSASTV